MSPSPLGAAEPLTFAAVIDWAVLGYLCAKDVHGVQDMPDAGLVWDFLAENENGPGGECPRAFVRFYDLFVKEGQAGTDEWINRGVIVLDAGSAEI